MGKSSILDIWLGFEYASAVPAESKVTLKKKQNIG